MSPTTTYQPPEPQRSGLLTALVAGALITLLAANIYLYVQIDHMRTDLASVQEKLTTQLSNLRDTSNVNTEAQKRHIETLKEELEAAKTGWLKSREVSRSNDGGLAGLLSAYLFYDRTLSFDAEREQTVRELTTAQVNATIKKYLDYSRMLRVKAGDFNKAVPGSQ